MNPSKYAAAFLQVAFVLLTAVIAALNKPLTTSALVQLGVLAVGAAGVYIVPLVDKAWAGAWKTGIAIVAAVLTAVLPFLSQSHLTTQNWLVVILAGLSAVATELGVVIRTDSAALLPALASAGQIASSFIGSTSSGTSTVEPVNMPSQPMLYVPMSTSGPTGNAPASDSVATPASVSTVVNVAPTSAGTSALG